MQPFLMPFWGKFNTSLEKVFSPAPSFDFLSHPIIQSTMFVSQEGEWLREEHSYLKKELGESKLLELAHEDACGKPRLLSTGAPTSHNSIHHLYHLIRFKNTVKSSFTKNQTVVEWGGGYGNMAKILQRMVPGITYVIIDLPLFSALQWLYLSVTLGPERVNFIRSREDQIEPHKINLITLCHLNDFKLRADIFISTWGLSESSEFSQDYVIEHLWFGAKHLLIGFQDSNQDLKYASRLGELAKKDGATVEPIAFIQGNYYAFR